MNFKEEFFFQMDSRSIRSNKPFFKMKEGIKIRDYECVRTIMYRDMNKCLLQI